MSTDIEHMVKGDVVEMPREEFERLTATIEMLESEDLKAGLLRSLQEFREGRSRPWRDVRDEL